MNMPIKTFWLLNSCIDRIHAQDDMRSLTVSSASQSSEGSQEFRSQLLLELGTVVSVDQELEVSKDGQSNLAGFAELKALSLMA